MSFFFGFQVFNSRVVDCDLAIGLCTLLPKAEVFKILWKVIDSTWQNYDKILVGSIYFGDFFVCVFGNEGEANWTTEKWKLLKFVMCWKLYWIKKDRFGAKINKQSLRLVWISSLKYLSSYSEYK